MRVFCVFLIRIASSIFSLKRKITLNYPKSAATGLFSWRLKHEFGTAVVNEPSVFEQLKFYCIYIQYRRCEVMRGGRETSPRTFYSVVYMFIFFQIISRILRIFLQRFLRHFGATLVTIQYFN